jgi:hypothetical protein
VLAKIAQMPQPDRAMGEWLHAIIKASAPALSPKLWYGMPAYAKEGKVVCFFQSAQKFKSRSATLSFSDEANLDEGAMWPTSFAPKELTGAEETRIGALVKRAVSCAQLLSPAARPVPYDRAAYRARDVIERAFKASNQVDSEPLPRPRRPRRTRRTARSWSTQATPKETAKAAPPNRLETR